MGGNEQSVIHLAARLSKEVVENPDIPDVDACIDLLEELEKVTITMSLLGKSKIGKYLTKSIKTFKRHKRTESTSGEDALADNWGRAIEMSTALLDDWKKAANKEAKSKTAKKNQEQNPNQPGLPKTAADYRIRLIAQKKEIYKDPPVVPPPSIVIESEKCPLPKRNKDTGELTFVAGEDSAIKALLKDFHPNRTPEGKSRSTISKVLKHVPKYSAFVLCPLTTYAYHDSILSLSSCHMETSLSRGTSCRVIWRNILSSDCIRRDECSLQRERCIERHSAQRMDRWGADE